YMMDRIGEVGDPCGIPFLTARSSPRMPSRHMAASLLLRNAAVHCTSWRGRCFARMTLRSRSWLTKSKNPLMSKVSADITRPWFCAASTLCTNVSIASSAELAGRPPNW
ncbi:hypothetical protein FOMPIDRAFT_1081517, partial [Fomitopsis schrenkii]